MRKVFLENLPTTRKGIAWKSSVGERINFEYENLKGEIEIVGYEKRYLMCKYLEEPTPRIHSSDLSKGAIGNLINMWTKDFKVEINQIFKDSKRNISIISRRHLPKYKNGILIQNEKWYEYKCSLCGYKDEIIEGALLNSGEGCSCCSGKTVIEGINTIWDTDRWMCDLGVSEEDAKKYTRRSHCKIYPKCKTCNTIRDTPITINNIYSQHSIGCKCVNKSYKSTNKE